MRLLFTPEYYFSGTVCHPVVIQRGCKHVKHRPYLYRAEQSNYCANGERDDTLQYSRQRSMLAVEGSPGRLSTHRDYPAAAPQRFLERNVVLAAQCLKE